MGSEAFQYRTQGLGELDLERYVSADVATEAGSARRVMIGRTPQRSVMTSPSSQDMRAISKSMCLRNAMASAWVASPASAERKMRSASLSPSGSVLASGWLWSAEVAP